MLILLSDLHFMDGTAGVDNLDFRIFEHMLRDMAERARTAKATEVKIALLGDIFDLVRSESWFRIPTEERPWGDRPSETAAIDGFDAIMLRNAATFEVLSSGLADRFGFPVEPERIYVPGNHDRLCNLYPSLRRKARQVLAMPAGDDPLPKVLLEPDYGVYGRHGHEFDPYNFEGSPVFGGLGDGPAEEKAYLEMPIGDVIAGEFASRLPVLVRQHVGELGPQGDVLVHKFRELFDVRPLAAIVDWLELRRMRQPAALENAINSSMRECAEDFAKIPFVGDWINRHDDWRNPFDDADKLQMLFGLLSRIDFTNLRSALDLAKSESESSEAHYPEMAQRDFAHLDSDPELRGRILYAVYGHTHSPTQAAVGVVGEGVEERNRVYINTGTWRPSHRRALDDSGFVAWNNLTVTYVYRPGEIGASNRRSSYPTFETWTGAFC
jgi:UDP-2,3-diacylglucosamine pyrophosphatase LpxH